MPAIAEEDGANLRLDDIIRLTAEQRRVRACDRDRAGIGRLSIGAASTQITFGSPGLSCIV